MSDDMTDAINLAAKLAEFEELWSPRVIGEFNGQALRLAKLQGEFVWHTHEDEDEAFLALDGVLRIHLRDRVIELQPGELFVVPRGVEHMTSAKQVASCLIITAKDSHTGGSDENPRGLDPNELERL